MEFDSTKYFIVFIFGCTTAFAELLSRYSNGFYIIKFIESWIYFSINGIASIISYYLINKFQIDLGPLTKYEIGKILIAGLSSMLILRSSFASVKIGNKNIDIGLSSILQIFLNTADRAFDRKRSKHDLEKISKLMNDVDFSKAKIELPALCINLMQNLDREDNVKIAQDVKAIENDNSSNKVKSINLGVILFRVAGLELLTTAIESIKDIIKINDSALPYNEQNEIFSQKITIKKLKDQIYNKILEK